MPSGIYQRKNKKTEEELKLSRKKIWDNYYSKNKESLLEKNKKRRLDNPNYYNEYEKKKYNSNPDFFRNKSKEYSKNNREIINNTRREKYSNDLNYKIQSILRSRFYKAMKRNKVNVHSMDIIGCSFEHFKSHIESKFQKGMTWDNWKYNGWHIDHIIPLSSFNLSDINEVKKAFHYTNLQPLWHIDNIKKYNHIPV